MTSSGASERGGVLEGEMTPSCGLPTPAALVEGVTGLRCGGWRVGRCPAGVATRQAG